MKKEFTSVEDLLTDNEFLAAYDGRNDAGKEKWQEWVNWAEADPSRAALLQQAIHFLTILRLAEAPVSIPDVPFPYARISPHPNPPQRPKNHPRFLLRNFLTIAARNLVKEKGFAAINIFGLALGLCVCLLITLYVLDELSYDRFNTNADRIYRVQNDIRFNGNNSNGVFAPAPMGPALVKDYPQIQQYVRLCAFHGILIKKGNTTVGESYYCLADSTIFDVFTLPLIAGNPHTALIHPFTMVISENMAKKYFGTVDCLGKILHVDNTKDYTITGVMKEMPEQSHFHAWFIGAMAEEPDSRNTDWLQNNGFVTYLLARPGATATDVSRCLDQLTQNRIIPAIRSFFHGKMDHLFEHDNNLYQFYPFPLTKIHIDSHTSEEIGNNGNRKYLYIFTTIAILILSIACVNFMNLSTARSARRAKEVGIRKVLGSLRTELIAQFLTESLLTCTLAMFIGLLMTLLLLPYLNQLSGKHITISFLTNSWLLPWLAVTILVVALLAGLYPAFFLSGFKPVQVLKGRLTVGFRSGWLRNSLVVFQFTIAILLIVGTGVIYRQLDYIRHKDLGYNRDQVLVIRNTYSLWIYARHFKEEVQRMPGVLDATMTFFLPNESYTSTNAFFKDAGMTPSQALLLTDWPIDADYVPTLGIKMARGRNFSPVLTTDSSAILINETTQQLLGYADPVGKTLYVPKDNGKIAAFRIIGVVKDFQPGSLHNKIPPMLFHLQEERGALAVRIKTADMPGLLTRIEKAFRSWDKMSDQPFPYYFMDEPFNQLYQDDQRTGSLFISFAGLAILIGCLGLFGLVTYAAEQRTREIGIRKILGASAVSIVRLLSKEFLWLTAIAALIAFPLGGWGMHVWLESFAYRANMSWWIFAGAGALALGITLLTISFRAIRAAHANPVKSLRTD